jgi:2-polyprenyl-6-hydroxyphenyl methylase/3-demethylubiquinone-9 3-methyltransferase
VRPAELAAYARQARLDLAATTGLVYNPFAKTFRLEPGDLDVNYMAAFRRHA